MEEELVFILTDPGQEVTTRANLSRNEWMSGKNKKKTWKDVHTM